MIIVRGNNLTHDEIECDGGSYELHTDTGMFNNNRTTIVWTEHGYWVATETAVVTENSIMIAGDDTLYKKNSD